MNEKLVHITPEIAKNHLLFTITEIEAEDIEVYNSNRIEETFSFLQSDEGMSGFTPEYVEETYKLALKSNSQEDVENYNNRIDSIIKDFGDNDFFKEKIKKLKELKA